MRSLRLDQALTERGFVDSRTKAKALIAAGAVRLDGKVIQKSAQQVLDNNHIDIDPSALPAYVSRGYRKLEKALDTFDINISGLRCIDVGASTGGFTQLMLQRGVANVIAIDVGSGQLAKILCEDRRVANMEKTDFRTVTRDLIGPVSFACVDVSFISLKLLLPNLYALLEPAGRAVCLIKPQFEAGPRRAGKHGVVKDPNVQAAAIAEVLLHAKMLGFSVQGLTFSPLRGGEGNLEFLVDLHKCDEDSCEFDPMLVVRAAWKECG